MSVCPAKTQISLCTHPVWSESSLSAWRNLGSLATQWAHSEDWSDWLIWVFAGCTVVFCWFCHVAAQMVKSYLSCVHLQIPEWSERLGSDDAECNILSFRDSLNSWRRSWTTGYLHASLQERGTLTFLSVQLNLAKFKNFWHCKSLKRLCHNFKRLILGPQFWSDNAM